ncbi:hypothetical protein Kpol_1050p63 [Vanderwaltozyma polyspora DSM 70294]|uniref:BRCT domain-containing protein n=1 Tax=Vanderwaltozyma polyspora (strain ATCC 22028 / DSM 70294 / BCRC 21397 / CBS 2163 / NBRC 10782 / NRRL Y-8283 / UCD 57-17) TaxID=436907 RepID=A7TEV9_VANPO|nr:uncharacterized protein Kpol_1050p63 [Vanderwaltozyma polyspora DSM 70294]EDO19205.1 hypothetical protein Kpol_1050p63 [Vanderwaltozyma polyspora DSM 70294]
MGGELFTNLNFLVIQEDEASDESVSELIRLLNENSSNRCEIYKNHGEESDSGTKLDSKQFIDRYGDVIFHFVISNTIDFAFYETITADFLVPVVTPDWIHSSLSAGRLSRVSIFSPNKDHFLRNSLIYISKHDFDNSERLFYRELITYLGGNYSEGITNTTTHIITTMPNDPALLTVLGYKHDIRVQFVFPTWLIACFKQNRHVLERDHFISPMDSIGTAKERLESIWKILNRHSADHTSTVDKFMSGHSFLIGKDVSSDKKIINIITEIITSRGGLILDESEINLLSSNCHFMGYQEGTEEYKTASSKNCSLGNVSWLFYLLNLKKFQKPENIMYHPYKKSVFNKDELILTYTNLFGPQRTYIKTLTNALGGVTTATLSHINNCLVYGIPEGMKYKTAEKWGDKLIIVGPNWLEECYKANKKLDPKLFRNYIVPESFIGALGQNRTLASPAPNVESDAVTELSKESSKVEDISSQSPKYVATELGSQTEENSNDVIHEEIIEIYNDELNNTINKTEEPEKDEVKYVSLDTEIDIQTVQSPTKSRDDLKSDEQIKHSKDIVKQGKMGEVSAKDAIYITGAEVIPQSNEELIQRRTKEVTNNEMHINGEEKPSIEKEVVVKQVEIISIEESKPENVKSTFDASSAPLLEETFTKSLEVEKKSNDEFIVSSDQILINEEPSNTSEIPVESQKYLASDSPLSLVTDASANLSFLESVSVVESVDRDSGHSDVSNESRLTQGKRSRHTRSQSIKHEVEERTRSSKRAKSQANIEGSITGIPGTSADNLTNAITILTDVLDKDTLDRVLRCMDGSQSTEENIYNIRAVCTGCLDKINEIDLVILRLIGIYIYNEVDEMYQLNTIIAPKKLRTVKFLKSLSFTPLQNALLPDFVMAILDRIHHRKPASIEFDLSQFTIPDIDITTIQKKSALGTKLFERAKIRHINIVSDIPGGINAITSILKVHGIETVNVVSNKFTIQELKLNRASPSQEGDEGEDENPVVPAYVLISNKATQVKRFKTQLKSNNITRNKTGLAVEWDWCVKCLFSLTVDLNDPTGIDYKSF